MIKHHSSPEQLMLLIKVMKLQQLQAQIKRETRHMPQTRWLMRLKIVFLRLKMGFLRLKHRIFEIQNWYSETQNSISETQNSISETQTRYF